MFKNMTPVILFDMLLNPSFKMTTAFISFWYPSGSAPARIHGTPKMYKFFSSDSFPKLRQIVSSIGTFNYNFAHFLCHLLSPLVPNDYSCKDTFSFVSQIKNVNLSKKFLVFYDVTSLFTNILLQETIDIAIDSSFPIIILI